MYYRSRELFEIYLLLQLQESNIIIGRPLIVTEIMEEFDVQKRRAFYFLS